MIHVSVTSLTHLFFVVGADEREIEHDKDNGAILSKGHRNGQQVQTHFLILPSTTHLSRRKFDICSMLPSISLENISNKKHTIRQSITYNMHF